MDRLVFSALKEWKEGKYRKPLLLRGARQIGKTTVIRQFGKLFENFVEVNFEKSASLHSVFEGDLDVPRILADLQLITRQSIQPGKTLLFLDEIQACPKALLSLRYFFETLPQLHVVAAGSLLEFAIEQIGLPVGRVSFLYMYPMSFIEFLWAMDEKLLAEAIVQQNPANPSSLTVHEKSLRLLGEYIAIGGMPEAVALWRDTKNYKQCLRVHADLLGAYKQDFQKYARKSQIKYVNHMFEQIPYQIGQRFIFSHVSGDFRKRELLPALELLKKANVVNSVTHTAGQGIPLGAHSKPDQFKLIMLDIALTQMLLGITSENWILKPEITFINKGNIAESFVGQELLSYSDSYQESSLYFWCRQKSSSQAEIDYLISKRNKVIPVEVKSGTGGTLKSMHLFLEEHPNSPYGIRYSMQNYSVFEKIHSYPLYGVMAMLKKE